MNYYYIMPKGEPGYWEWAYTASQAAVMHQLIYGSSAAVRKAAYGEWDCMPECITIDGKHDHSKKKLLG